MHSPSSWSMLLNLRARIRCRCGVSWRRSPLTARGRSNDTSRGASRELRRHVAKKELVVFWWTWMEDQSIGVAQPTAYQRRQTARTCDQACIFLRSSRRCCSIPTSSSSGSWEMGRQELRKALALMIWCSTDALCLTSSDRIAAKLSRVRLPKDSVACCDTRGTFMVIASYELDHA